MDKAAVLKIITRFREALEKRGTRPSRIVLYGSYALGNYHEGSDIDLVVVSDDFVGKGFWERIDILARGVCDVWEPIEAVAMTVEEWEKGDSMIAQFAREGELVYAG
jgi:predicted nucleotidyltransferase